VIAVELAEDGIKYLVVLIERFEETVTFVEDELELLAGEGALPWHLLKMESLKSDLGGVDKDEWCELLELDVFIVVGIKAEHVPENILEFTHSSFVQHLSNEQLQLVFLKVFSLDVVHIQRFEVSPNFLVELLVFRHWLISVDKALPIS